MRAGLAPMRERQARLLLEINSLVAEIPDASATAIEDFLALLDVALEHELDLAPEIAFYGPADYPIITRLLRALAGAEGRGNEYQGERLPKKQSEWDVAIASINRAAGGDRPELLDAVATDGDVPVVEVDGRVAMAGDEADLVADLETVGGARDAEPSVLVGGALGGGGGFVADERGTRVEGERPEAGIDDCAVLGRAVHHRRPTEGLGSKALVETPAWSRLRP